MCNCKFKIKAMFRKKRRRKNDFWVSQFYRNYLEMRVNVFKRFRKRNITVKS